MEERLATDREDVFLSEGPPAAGPTWDGASFYFAYDSHFSRHVGVNKARARGCQTFAALNRPALLPTESNQDVVRMESVAGLVVMNKSVFDPVAELAAALRALAEKGESALTDDERGRLDEWLAGVNRTRDSRPMFASPWGEVEPLLRDPAWASRLRDAMGLVHLGGTADDPLPVALMRYNLSRSEKAAQNAGLAAWAATPTVLEAGTHRGPNLAFFPFPQAALGESEPGFGQTVHLGPDDDPDWTSELLHFRIDYELTDFNRVEELTDRIDDPQLAEARRRHLDLLADDLRFRADVP